MGHRDLADLRDRRALVVRQVVGSMLTVDFRALPVVHSDRGFRKGMPLAGYKARAGWLGRCSPHSANVGWVG